MSDEVNANYPSARPPGVFLNFPPRHNKAIVEIAQQALQVLDSYELSSKGNIPVESDRQATSTAAAATISTDDLDFAQLSIDNTSKKPDPVTSKRKAAMANREGAEIPPALTKHQDVHQKLKVNEDGWGCPACSFATLDRDEFLTDKGFYEFKKLLDDPRWFDAMAKKYIKMNREIEKLEKGSLEHRLAKTRERCWVRLRLENRMESTQGSVNVALLRSYFKDEKSTPAKEAQHWANNEEFLSKEGLEELWVMFEYQPEWTNDYLRLLEIAPTDSPTDKIRRVAHMLRWFVIWFERDMEHNAALEKAKSFLAKDIREAMEMIRKAGDLAEEETFLSEEGKNLIYPVFCFFGLRNAKKYMNMHEIRAGMGEKEIKDRARLRANMLRDLFSKHSDLNDEEDRQQIWNFFTVEHNTMLAKEKALNLVKDEEFLTKLGVDTWVKALQKDPALALKYVQFVDVKRERSFRRALWISNNIVNMTGFDKKNRRTLLTDDFVKINQIWLAQNVIEKETELLSEHGIALCKKIFDTNFYLAQKYLDKKAAKANPWGVMRTTIEQDPELEGGKEDGTYYDTLFKSYEPKYLKKTLEDMARELIQEEKVLSERGMKYFAKMMNGPCTVAHTRLHYDTTLARAYLREVWEKNKEHKAKPRMLWFLQVLAEFPDPVTYDRVEVRFAEGLFTVTAWQEIFVRNAIQLAKDNADSEIVFTQAGYRVFCEMVEKDWRVGYTFSGFVTVEIVKKPIAKVHWETRRLMDWLVAKIGAYVADETGTFDEQAVRAMYVKEPNDVKEFFKSQGEREADEDEMEAGEMEADEMETDDMKADEADEIGADESEAHEGEVDEGQVDEGEVDESEFDDSDEEYERRKNERYPKILDHLLRQIEDDIERDMDGCVDLMGGVDLAGDAGGDA